LHCFLLLPSKFLFLFSQREMQRYTSDEETLKLLCAQLQRQIQNQQREIDGLRDEKRQFYHFLKSEGGKGLVRKYNEWCIVQTLLSYEDSVFSLLSPELIVLIFSHLDECSLATVAEVCKSWKMITDLHEDYLWKRLAHDFFVFCPDPRFEEQRMSLKRDKDPMESWKQFFRRSLATQPTIQLYPTPLLGLHFDVPIQLTHSCLYIRNSTRYALTFFRVMVTTPKDYVVKPTHGILQPRHFIKISISARPLSKEVLEQTKGCRDKFMIQTMTVTVDQLIDEGVIDVKKAELSQIRKGRSCTLDLAHILPENFDSRRYVKLNPTKVTKHIFKCHYLELSCKKKDSK
jgi:hypothetical protein